jgi:hypothetical protein
MAKSLLKGNFVPAQIVTKPKDRKTYYSEKAVAAREREKERERLRGKRIRKRRSEYGAIPVEAVTRDRILEAVALGYRLNEVPKRAGIGWVRLLRLLRDDAEFAAQYHLAKQAALEVMEDEIFEIADDTRRDRKKGKVDKEHINRSRLRIEVRKWIMKCRAPRRYGDKVLQALDGPPGSKISFTMKFGDHPANDGDIIEGEAVDVTDLEEAG